MSALAGQNDTYRIVEGRVVHLGFVVGSDLVDRVTSGTGQVDNHSEFPRGLFLDYADRVQVKEGKRKLEKRVAETI